MRLSNVFALGIWALACAALAQEAPRGNKLEAFVQLPQGKPSKMILEDADGDHFIFTERTTESQMKALAKDCKLFFITTPADLAAAAAKFGEGNMAAARKELAAVKTKYAKFAALPGNPAQAAALMEIEAAVHMKDWPAVKALAASFPRPGKLPEIKKGILTAASLIGQVSDNPAEARELQKAVEEYKGDAKGMGSVYYAWICYAKGRAAAAQIPAEQIDGGIAEDKLELANQAIDGLCQCIVASHGANGELAADSALRAVKLLYATPGTAEAAKKLRGNVSKQTWAGAPQNLRDAIALALLYKNVYAPESKDELIDRLASLYYSSAQDRASASPAKAK